MFIVLFCIYLILRLGEDQRSKQVNILFYLSLFLAILWPSVPWLVKPVCLLSSKVVGFRNETQALLKKPTSGSGRLNPTQKWILFL